ncbi:S8 family serine peptidase [Haloferula sp. A504]|uniref:S8 family serine peptidase n=1 Tax=Haloferula sp. A504 TaxID=3373601 RepID=UPI0031C54E89|nr:S8 family serine peptidase [Verrucomicrobiaceae bacterium E54]
MILILAWGRNWRGQDERGSGSTVMVSQREAAQSRSPAGLAAGEAGNGRGEAGRESEKEERPRDRGFRGDHAWGRTSAGTTTVSNGGRRGDLDGKQRVGAVRRDPAPEPRPEGDIAAILEGVDMADEKQRAAAVAKIRALEDARLDWARAKARRMSIPIIIPREDGSKAELFDFVEDRPQYRATNNQDAAISTNAAALRVSPFSVTGGSLRVGVWDEARVRNSHQEFGSRVSIQDSSPTFSNHATHVAGTIGASGTVSSAKGMAPAVRIHSYDWNSDGSEFASAGAATPLQSSRVLVSNHSYGFIRGYSWNNGWTWYGSGTSSSSVDPEFGRYSDSSRSWDSYAQSLPYTLICKAAGNDRNNNPSNGSIVQVRSTGGTFTMSSSSPKGDGIYKGGYDLIEGMGLSKNVLTVGAVDDAVSGSSRSVGAASMSSFSSWGPADDGRIKPDVVGNGVGVYSPVATSDSAYSSYGGTSMATPNVAGTAMLLTDYYQKRFPGQQMRASTLKALLIHTADDLGRPGPDYQNGWGLVNGKAAAEVIDQHASSSGSPKIIESQVGSNAVKVHTFQWDGVGAIRATLVWHDPAGTEKSGGDNRSKALVNDLDLKVIAPNSTQYYPFVMPHVGSWSQSSLSQTATTGVNSVDNVEQVLIQNPGTPGTFTVEVRANGSFSGGQQAYSLILTGSATASAQTRVIDLSGSLSFGNVTTGQSAFRNLLIRNLGNDDLSISSISYPTGFSGSTSGAVIPPGGSINRTVTFAPSTGGAYSGNVTVFSDKTSGTNTRLATGSGVVGVTNLNNGVPVTGLSGDGGSERVYRFSVPPGQESLSFEISGGSGDCDLYVRYGSIPTTSDWDHRPYLGGNDETVTINNPAAGDWYVMLRGYSSYSGVSLVASYQAPVVTTRIIRLSGSLSFGQVSTFSTSDRELRIHNDGNAPLSVSSINLPTGFSGSWSGNIAPGGSQAVTITFAPVDDIVYAGNLSVNSNKTSGVSIASISGSGVNSVYPLSNGIPVNGLNGLLGSEQFFKITVPSGQTRLTVSTSGGIGDVDLYVRRGSEPTISSYTQRSISSGNSETITITNPQSGEWFILLHAFSQYRDVQLIASYEAVVAQTRIIRLTGNLAFGDVKIGQSKTQFFTIHNDGNSSLFVNGLNLPQGFTGNYSGSIPSGQSQSVGVTFEPFNAASYGGNLVVNSNATSGGSTMPVSGTGSGTLALSRLESTATAAGGSGAIDVSCSGPWSWSTAAAWISSAFGSNQSGNLEFVFSVAENPSTDPRTAVISFTQGGLTLVHTVTQAGSAPLLELSADARGFSSGGAASSNFNVISNQTWSWSKSVSWITSSEPGSQNGNTVFSYSVAANPTTAIREGIITFTQGPLTRIHRVTQAGAAVTLDLNTTRIQNVSSSGASYVVSVSSNGEWHWVSDAAWGKAPSEAAVQSGNQTFSLSVDPNPTVFGRSMNFNFSHGALNKTLTVEQAGAQATLTLGSLSSLIGGEGGGADIDVTSNTAWNWFTNDSWVTAVGQPPQQSGSRTFSLSIEQNSSSTPRTGTIYFHTPDYSTFESHTVTQEGFVSELTVTPTQRNVDESGGVFDLTVGSNTSWDWSSSGDSWVTSGELPSQDGPQTFTYEVGANTSSAPRSTLLTFQAGGIIRTHEILQAGSAAADPPKITNLESSGSSAIISFETIVGRSYRIRWGPNLDSMPNKLEGIPGSGGVVTRTLAGAGSALNDRMFFTVEDY